MLPLYYNLLLEIVQVVLNFILCMISNPEYAFALVWEGVKVRVYKTCNRRS